MYSKPLDHIPLGLMFVFVAALAGAAVEGGYRFGRWRHARIAEEKETPVGAMVGTILGLLAFVIAFTFGLAATRFEARRQIVLNEANAIGTAYLRTDLLPEPQRGASGRLLREYVDVRLRGASADRIAAAVDRSEELHALLWTQAVQAAERQPGPITGLYVQALNETIDLHAKRVQAVVRDRIPTGIWFVLLILTLLGMGATGYQSGLSETRRSPAMIALVLAFAAILHLIADMDRGRDGLLQVSQQAMIDLQQSMAGGKPGAG
ncbi:MAG: hypothetical protein U0871_20585 [Gemmataceae bacterium]